MKTLRIATRESQLALKQTDIVKEAILKHFPDCEIILVPMTTTGDQLIDQSLATVGGKGLFIKELEKALLDNRADIAVHSTKDIPAECAPGLEITTFLERDDPRDCFLSSNYMTLAELPKGAIVGTSSPRRQSMIYHLRPDTHVKLLRGNVITRIRKMDDGEYDGIIVAAAALHRLDLDNLIREYFSFEDGLPAIGQGVIAIECRAQDKALHKFLSVLDHFPTRQCVLAERALNKHLGGNCHSPIGGYAIIENNKIILRGSVSLLKSSLAGEDPELLGEKVAADLFKQGAQEILSSTAALPPKK